MKKNFLIIILTLMMLFLTNIVIYATEYDYLQIIPKTDVPDGFYIGSYMFNKGEEENTIKISSNDETKMVSFEENVENYSIVNEGNIYLFINKTYDAIVPHNQYGAIINNSPIYFFDDKMQLISKKEFVGHMKYEGYYGDNFYFSFSDYSERYYDDVTSSFKGNVSSHYYKTVEGMVFEEITYDNFVSLEKNKLSKLLDGNKFHIKDDDVYLKIKQDDKKVSYESANHTLHGAITTNGNIFYKEIYENDQVTSKRVSIDSMNFYEIPLDADLSNAKCDSEYLYCNIARNEEWCYKIRLSDFKAGVKVVYKGEYLSFATNPVIEDGRTLVPIRFLFEKMGAKVDWDNTIQTAIIEKDNDVISFAIDNTIAKVNNSDKIMDVPARLINGKTMIPLRFLSEELGFKVEWDEQTKTVIINE